VLSTLAEAFPDDPAVGEEDSGDLRKGENAELFSRVIEYAQKVDSSLDADSVLAAIDRGNHVGGARGRFWTLDPIDGTKGFLRGQQYAVALALIEDGEVVLGVLGCPNLPVDPDHSNSEIGSILFAVKGQGAYQAPLSDLSAAVPISTDTVSEPAQAVFCESVESGHTAHGRSAAITEALGTSVEPFRMDSQCKYAAVSRGQASVYLRLPTRPGYEEKIWDHAAGYLVLLEAGGKIADTFGEPLDFSLGRTLKNNKGIVATSPAVFEAVVKAVVASSD
jgi:3'(2'), 5'-bisphosphate nucleotidase